MSGSKEVRQSLRQLQHSEREVTAQNDAILLSGLDDGAMDVEEQPLIVQEGVRLAQADVASGLADDAAVLSFKCTIQKCNMDLELLSLDALLEHHQQYHPGVIWRKPKCLKYNVSCCTKCHRLFKNDVTTIYCEHLAAKQDTANPRADMYPEKYWSITIVAVRTDVPVGLLKEYNDALDTVECQVAVACLERGDKENHLHLQSAAALCWDPADSKGLAKHFRKELKLDTKYADLTFKMRFKLFEQGQTWLCMVGYCQKWRDYREYQLVHRGMKMEDLLRGQVHHTVYRSDYTKDKFVITNDNVLKASFAHWSATSKPEFIDFTDNMYAMLKTGDYVLSGKLLSSTPMDRTRTEEAWSTLLKPYETTVSQVAAIFFGSAPKTLQNNENTRPRYELDKFCPGSMDGGLIKMLQHHMVRRRENMVIVGPAGCGKSCLIQTLTVQHGVQYFGTADELREVSARVEFVVFDDFDFTDFSTDDMKRLLDREFDTQRVKVRYKDALLTKEMTRVILCNELPKCLDDPAVRDRYVGVVGCMWECLRGWGSV
jgi:hypothetical protein